MPDTTHRRDDVGHSPTIPHNTANGALPSLDGGFQDRYQPRGTIGQGGMGEVRLCLDGHIGREVAMKVVREPASAAGSRPEGQARFLREACVQGQLEHPSIVPVYDLGRDPQGALYFTMKRVRGATLADILDQLDAGDADAVRSYSRRKLLSAFTSACLAVEFAHSRGVLHRDLKPSNIMLGDFGEVYVLDWGLAKLGAQAGDQAPRAEATAAALTASASGGGRDTTHGSLLGTPGYMSPEQAAGRTDDVDARSDVYALGAILFEILAYAPLHEGEHAAALLASTLEGADARPSVRAPERDVPPELDAICAKATAHRPEARHATVRELCQAVERYLDGDRDLALRKGLAAAHAEAARAAADRLFGEGVEADRVLALREAGRALALDPRDPLAARTVLKLLTTPPREPPAEVVAERDALARAEQKSVMRIGALSFMSWVLYLPLAFWVGIASIPLMATIAALWTLSAAGMTFYHRRPTGRVPLWLVLLASGTVALTTTHFGPLVMLPGLATLTTFAFMMSSDRRFRLVVIAAGVLAMLVPAALELGGVLPPSYTFERGALVIHSSAFRLNPVPTLLFLAVVGAQVIITAAVAVARMRDLLSGVEQRMMVQAWQLRKLVPEETAAGVPTPVARVEEPSCILTG